MAELRHSFKVGEGVMVFQDPFMQTKQEGMATIVKLREVNDYYDVVFDNEQSVYPRFIYKKE
jgi:hypothetical protein